MRTKTNYTKKPSSQSIENYILIKIINYFVQSLL